MKTGVFVEFDWDHTKVYTSMVPVACRAEDGRRFKKLKSTKEITIKNKDITVVVYPSGKVVIEKHNQYE